MNTVAAASTFNYVHFRNMCYHIYLVALVSGYLWFFRMFDSMQHLSDPTVTPGTLFQVLFATSFGRSVMLGTRQAISQYSCASVCFLLTITLLHMPWPTTTQSCVLGQHRQMSHNVSTFEILVLGKRLYSILERKAILLIFRSGQIHL